MQGCGKPGNCVVQNPAGGKFLVATAGGIRTNVVKDALKAGADILVVGRAITACKDVNHAADEFLEQLAGKRAGGEGL